MEAVEAGCSMSQARAPGGRELPPVAPVALAVLVVSLETPAPQEGHAALCCRFLWDQREQRPAVRSSLNSFPRSCGMQATAISLRFRSTCRAPAAVFAGNLWPPALAPYPSPQPKVLTAAGSPRRRHDRTAAASAWWPHRHQPAADPGTQRQAAAAGPGSRCRLVSARGVHTCQPCPAAAAPTAAAAAAAAVRSLHRGVCRMLGTCRGR